MSQIESETQLSAPTSPFEPISEEISPNGTRKAENLPHYKTSIPHSSRISGHYTTHSMSTDRVIADDCYCNRCQNALSDSDSSKVESPSPICQSQSRDWLGESVLVLPNGQKHKPVSLWARQSRAIPNIHHTLPRQRSYVGTPYKQGRYNHKFKN